MDKENLRKKLKSITVSDRKEKDLIIAKYLFMTDEYKKAKNIYLFKSAFNEPDTNIMIERAFLDGKRVFLPVTNDNIRFAEINVSTKFGIHKYGMQEPINPVFGNYQPDIVIVPMVGYDKNKGRLGHGKGYYDRFLSGLNVVKIGVSFSDFLVDNTFSNRHDISMDKIITDKGIIE